jgi:hypothetical protein
LTPQKIGATLLPMKLLVKQKAKAADNGKEKLLPFENEVTCAALYELHHISANLQKQNIVAMFVL